MKQALAMTFPWPKASSGATRNNAMAAPAGKGGGSSNHRTTRPMPLEGPNVAAASGSAQRRRAGIASRAPRPIFPIASIWYSKTNLLLVSR